MNPRGRRRSIIPPLGARESFEIVDVGPPLTPEQIKAWREERGLPDPNCQLVPTAAELAKLPRLARQAFAERCARRVAPLAGASPPTQMDPQAAAALIVAAATVQTPLTRQLRCIRRDFDRLLFRAKKYKWTDETAVSPALFGALWPKGLEPAWAAAGV